MTILIETAQLVKETLQGDLNGLAVERAVVGIFFTGVKLTNGAAGVCFTPTGELPEAVCCPSSAGRSFDPVKIKGIEVNSVLSALESTEPIKTAGAYDIAVCPSLYEGFPNTVVEYLAASRPVVTTDAGGVPEMINHRENGLLVPCDDEEKLFENVLELVQNQNLRKTLQFNARETIREKFSEDIMLDKLEAFFRQTIEQYQLP